MDSIPGTTYKANLILAGAAIEWLNGNNYKLNMAKQVLHANGATTTNTVLTSFDVAQEMEAEWKEVYGFNYTTQLPVQGGVIALDGAWQYCPLGQALTLDSTGSWVTNTADVSPGFMSVRNDYQPVFLVLGIQNMQDRSWSPIFYSPEQAPPQGLAQYEPSEVVQFWYGEGQQNGSVIDKQETQVVTFDMRSTQEQGYTHWFQWQMSGKWLDQNQAFS